MNSLIIIFTLFDADTSEYLKLFESGDTIIPRAKGLGCNLYYDDLQPINQPESIDVLIIPEDYNLSAIEELVLKELISLNQRIYLTLHEGGKRKAELEHKIDELAGVKLQLPIKEEIHTKGGVAFDMLLDLGKNYKSSEADYYTSIINNYLKNDGFDLSLEVKFELIHLLNDLEIIEELLETSQPPTSLLDLKMSELLKIEPIKEKVNSYLAATPPPFYSERIQTVQSILFSDNLS